MAIQYERLRNWHFDDRTDHYSTRDSILYALTLGYGAQPTDAEDLRFVHEQDTLAVPTRLAVVGAPGAWASDPDTGIDWVRLLHGEHRMTFHAPVPAQAAITSKTRVTHVVDKGAAKGALVVTTRDISDAGSGRPLATVEHVSFCRADGGFGKGDEPLPPLPAVPAGPPRHTVLVPSLPQAALLYRLNGDLNPIHALPAMAAKAGFDRPILHGLCTYGMAARALVKACCPTAPSRMRSFSVRFSAPMYPGETLRVETWHDATAVHFRAVAHERGAEVLSNGIATID
ncbi:MaoC family dehydratase [Bordetella sp. BOR01]|uniref:MaoC family dehydratase n=1 Tax=Bordetella sp. BOR01 TaxID=2854779 RepID=UPI001C446D81|nr:MaoC family dehydratase [Bordetella sp. BOR01]MBV7483565.1 MaoC family dehydratase N-terminal domain-containing protein [Bordetella sp. BOR01]